MSRPEPSEEGGAEDAALVRACLARAEGAVERLIERHRRLAHHAILQALERAGAAHDQDLREEAFARLLAALAADDMKVLRGFQGRSRLGTFIVVIARRAALRALDERRRGAVPPSARRASETEADAAAASGPSASTRAIGEEERKIVRGALAELPARDALALKLFYEDARSHKEIGVVLGVPVTHVGQILSRAREKLRPKLQRAGLGDDKAE